MSISVKDKKECSLPKRKWGILPFNSEKISGKYLVTSTLGGWCILEPEEFSQLHSYNLKENSSLYKKLKSSGLLLTESNLDNVVNSYRTSNINLFSGPYLHIAVVTERCNLGCKYCQTRKNNASDMSIETASRVLDFLAASNAPLPILEIQGGEPLCNWNTIEFLVKNVSSNRTVFKNVKIIMVSNLLLLDDKKLNFLIDNDVGLCSSLDGPEFIHNKNRIFSNGQGTYKEVTGKIKLINEIYKKRNMKNSVGLLPTITKDSLPYYKEIVDEYSKWGQGSIAIRYANRLGGAKGSWIQVGVTTEEFCEFWRKAVDYIIELNKRGRKIFERTLYVILQKMLNKSDPRFVDMMSPCGAGRSVLTYAPSGDIYTCDEARMLDDEIFKIGNIHENSYEKVMDSPVLLNACKASLLELWDYSSPYKVWAGTCPVLNYAQQKSPVVKVCDAAVYKILKFQFRYLFKKIIEDKKCLTVFKKWVSYK